MLAFRCKNCGHNASAGHAGDNDLPHACVVCDAGVQWVKGVKFLDPSNWIVLAECTAEQLTEFGLTYEEVTAHSGSNVPPEIGRQVLREVSEVTVTKDTV